MPGRQYSSNSYRYGFNGQDKVDEIKGLGNHNTALFWEYDTRLVRRWNVDPVVKPWESPYLTFGGNPILYSDVLGDDKDDRKLRKEKRKVEKERREASKIAKAEPGSLASVKASDFEKMDKKYSRRSGTSTATGLDYDLKTSDLKSDVIDKVIDFPNDENRGDYTTPPVTIPDNTVSVKMKVDAFTIPDKFELLGNENIAIINTGFKSGSTTTTPTSIPIGVTSAHIKVTTEQVPKRGSRSSSALIFQVERKFDGNGIKIINQYSNTKIPDKTK